GLVGAVVAGALAGGSLLDGLQRATFPGAIPTLPPFLGALLASGAVTVGVSLLGRQVTDLEAVGARVPALSGG
nr:hypothetical protein [Actinomycetota bacterium]